MPEKCKVCSDHLRGSRATFFQDQMREDFSFLKNLSLYISRLTSNLTPHIHHWLPSHNRAILEKCIVPCLVNKIHHFCLAARLLAVFTTAEHLALQWNITYASSPRPHVRFLLKGCTLALSFHLHLHSGNLKFTGWNSVCFFSCSVYVRCSSFFSKYTFFCTFI